MSIVMPGTFVVTAGVPLRDDPTKMTRFVLVILDGTKTFLVSTKNSKGKKLGMVSTGISGVKASSHSELVSQLPEYMGAIYRVVEDMTMIEDASKLEQLGMITSETGDGGRMVFIMVRLSPGDSEKITARHSKRHTIVCVPIEELLKMYQDEDRKLRARGYTTYFHADLLNFGRILNELAACDRSISPSVESIMYRAINNTTRKIVFDSACSSTLSEIMAS